MSSRRPAAERPTRHRLRPRLEVLEDRSVPSVVVTTEDNGNNAAPTPGSLRAAILAANRTPGPDVITFNIPAADPGHVYYPNDGTAGRLSVGGVVATAAPIGAEPADIDPDWAHSWWSIRPPAPLPAVTGPVTVNGLSQPGASDGGIELGGRPVLRIELDGEKAGPADGLWLRAGGCTLAGLIINRFAGSGISLDHNGSTTVVRGNFLGPDASGTVDVGNGLAGLRTLNAGAQIGSTDPRARNVISGNQFGILLSNSGTSFATRIRGNYIGLDVTGTRDLGNSSVGVAVGSAPMTRVGGTAPGAGNVISGNRVGVSIVSISHPVIPGGYNCLVQGNLIGLNAAGTAAVGNATGVHVTTRDNLIGGYAAAARNVISGNTADGVRIARLEAAGFRAVGNAVVGNLIGTDATGARPVGNGADGVRVSDGAAGNLVGWNLVGFNGAAGVRVSDAVGNRVRHNFTLFNGLDGIRLEHAAGSHVAWNASHDNGRDGIALSDAGGNTVLSNQVHDNGRDGIGLENGDANSVYANRASSNGRDGVRLDKESAGNRVRGNRLIGSAEHDGHDDSAGAGTAGTANLWLTNWGVTENRPGLF